MNEYNELMVLATTSDMPRDFISAVLDFAKSLQDCGQILKPAFDPRTKDSP